MSESQSIETASSTEEPATTTGSDTGRFGFTPEDSELAKRFFSEDYTRPQPFI